MCMLIGAKLCDELSLLVIRSDTMYRFKLMGVVTERMLISLLNS